MRALYAFIQQSKEPRAFISFVPPCSRVLHIVSDVREKRAAAGVFIVRAVRSGVLQRCIDYGIPEPTTWYLVTSSYNLTATYG